MKASGSSGNPWRFLRLTLLLLIGCVVPARGFEIPARDGVEIRWDTTLRYSAAARLADPNRRLLAYPNSNDGDGNFADAGLVSNRFDLVSALDVSAGDFGAQASIAAWYDSVYHGRSDNHDPATLNAGAPGRFPNATRRIDGAFVELADSFVFANLLLDGAAVNFRAGRQTLAWGESLFYSTDSIAAAMAPVDYVRNLFSPGSYARNSYLPADQVLLTVQPDDDLSVAAYYQFDFRPSRLPGVGSYFSTSDIEGPGTERAFAGTRLLSHVADRLPGSGGYGLSLHKRIDEIDLGIYALRYTATFPVLEAYAQGASGGAFYSSYPGDIDLYGISANGYWGDVTVAGEVSLRRNAPLVSTSPISLYFSAPLGKSDYAQGDVLAFRVSAVGTLAPGRLWDSADLSLELNANDVVAMTGMPSAFSPRRGRFASGLRILLQPHYFQVLPNLDVTPELGLGYNPKGSSGLDYARFEGTGNYELGLGATYRSVWKLNLTMTGFIGAPARQFLADRDFLLLGLERTF